MRHILTIEANDGKVLRLELPKGVSAVKITKKLARLNRGDSEESVTRFLSFKEVQALAMVVGFCQDHNKLCSPPNGG